jgi:hypothetical protein
MPDVKEVIVQLRGPNGRPGDYGQATSGFYQVDGKGRLTMTDEKGVPVRRKNGELWTHLLKPEEKPEVIARILTKQIRAAIHGDSVGFHRRIEWPNVGWR